MGEETKHAETVVNRHHHDAFRREALAVVAKLGAVAGDKAAAVEVDQHGQSFAIRLGGRPNVQVETIFADAVRSKTHVGEEPRLHTTWTKLTRLPDAIPVLNWLWLAPAQVVDRWLGK